MNRQLGHKLIDKLYNSGNLSLDRSYTLRKELNDLEEGQIEPFLSNLPNAEYFLSELINPIRNLEKPEEDDQTPKPESNKTINKISNILFFGHFTKTARSFMRWVFGTYTTFRIWSFIVGFAIGYFPAWQLVEYAVFLAVFILLSFLTYQFKLLKSWVFKIIPNDSENWNSFKSSLSNNERIALSMLLGYFLFNLFLLIASYPSSFWRYENIWFVQTSFDEIEYYDITDFLAFNFIPCIMFYAYFSLKPKP